MARRPTRFTVEVCGTDSILIDERSFNATSILKIRVTNRHRTFQSTNGVETLAAENLSPTLQLISDLPDIFLAMPEFLESYLRDCVLSKFDLDSSVVNTLEPKIRHVAMGMIERTGRMTGFIVIVNLLITNSYLVTDEEVSSRQR